MNGLWDTSGIRPRSDVVVLQPVESCPTATSAFIESKPSSVL